MLFISTKGQIWSIDFIIGVVIFLIALALAFKYLINVSSAEVGSVDMLTDDAEVISNSLLSEGIPEDWDPSNVVQIGILSDNKLDYSKYDSLTEVGYLESKKLFKTKYDYYFYFLNNTGDVFKVNGLEGFGKSGVNKDNIYDVEDIDKLVRLNRLVTNGSVILSLNLYVWE